MPVIPIATYNGLHQFQSVFGHHHSTETALINIYDRLYNKQLLNEVEHDIENYQGRGLRYHTNQGLDNSRYHAKTEFNTKKCIQNQKTKNTEISCQVNSYNIFLMFSQCSNVFKTIK